MLFRSVLRFLNNNYLKKPQMKAEGVMAINHLLSEDITIKDIYNSLNLNSEDVVDISRSSRFIGLNSKNIMTNLQALGYYDLVFKKKTATEIRSKWHTQDKYFLVWAVAIYCKHYGIENFGMTPENWKELAFILKMKDEFLMRKWITIIKHTTHFYDWTHEEEAAVRRYMGDKRQQYHWSDMAVKIYSEGHSPILRTCKDIREHWNNHMNPSLKKSNWTKSEDQQLLQLVKQKGRKWSLISKSIDGRTQNQVKNRYFSLLKKNSLTSDEPNSTQHSHSQPDHQELLDIRIEESPFLIDFNEDEFYETVSFDFQEVGDPDMFINF